MPGCKNSSTGSAEHILPHCVVKIRLLATALSTFLWYCYERAQSSWAQRSSPTWSPAQLPRDELGKVLSLWLELGTASELGCPNSCTFFQPFRAGTPFPALQSRDPASPYARSLEKAPAPARSSPRQIAAPCLISLSSRLNTACLTLRRKRQLGLGILHLSLESCHRCSSQVTLAEVQRAGRLPRHLGGDAGLGQRARGRSSELRPPPRSKAAKLTTAAAPLRFPLESRRVKSHLSKEQQGKSFAQGRKKKKIPFTQQLLPQLCKERGQGWCQRQ